MRMVVFDRLGDIDDVEVGVVREDVVFEEVSMNEFTFMIHLANCEELLVDA